MNKNLFLDVNVVIDFLDSSRTQHSQAVELVKYSTINSYEVFISEDMLTTIYYILKDKQATLKFFKTIIKRWNITSFGVDVINSGIDISLKNGLDLEDILQCLCAKKNGCDIFITNDKQFYNCGLSIYTITQFLESTE